MKNLNFIVVYCATLIILIFAKEPTIIILGQSGMTSNTHNTDSNTEQISSSIINPSRSGPTSSPSTVTPLSSLTSSLNLLRYRLSERKKNNNKDGPHIIYISSSNQANRPSNNNNNMNMMQSLATSASISSPMGFISPPPTPHSASPPTTLPIPSHQIMPRNYPVYQPHHQVSGPLVPNNYQYSPYSVTSGYPNHNHHHHHHHPNHYPDYDSSEYSWSGW